MNRGGIRRSADAGDEALVEGLSRAARALASADADADGGPSPGAWHRLNDARGAAPSARAPRTRAFVLAGAFATVALVALGGALRLARTASPLTFAVSGGALEKGGGGGGPSGGYVRAIGGAGTQVRFSDGTEVNLSEGARLSVAAPGPRGARLRLDAGRAEFQVVHLPRAAWSVEAGPFVVEVTGTVFDVGWSGRDEVVEVHLRSGSVRVSGPLLQERVVLRAGQRLMARLGSGEVRIDDGRADVENQRVPAPAPTAGARPPAGASAATTDVAGPASPGAATGAETVAPTPSLEPARAPSVAVARPTLRGASHARDTARAVVALRTDGHAAVAAPRQETPPPAETPPASDEPAAPSAAPGSPGASDPSVSAALAHGDRDADANLVTAPSATKPSSLVARDEVAALGSPAPARTPTAPRPSVPNIWNQRRWSAQVAAGDSTSVLTDAEQLGLGATLGGADSANLAALADAARYSGRGDLAAAALLAERRRFPGTARAQVAAFLLGRMADDRGDVRSGLQWYRHYLDEAPNGAYAAEALGRQMLAVERLRGRPAARTIAGVYLRRFPNGTYLLQARAILDENR